MKFGYASILILSLISSFLFSAADLHKLAKTSSNRDLVENNEPEISTKRKVESNHLAKATMLTTAVVVNNLLTQNKFLRYAISAVVLGLQIDQLNSAQAIMQQKIKSGHLSQDDVRNKRSKNLAKGVFFAGFAYANDTLFNDGIFAKCVTFLSATRVAYCWYAAVAAHLALT